jgi:hypothetical protein
MLRALEMSNDQVRVSALEPDQMRTALEAGELRIAHANSEDRPILLAATPHLRSELSTCLARPGALDKPDVWRRTTARPAPAEVPCFEASAWQEADQLFHRDPHWTGADVASSVDLGGGRILWLFGDTWIDPTGRGTRQGATMISNSVAIQTGTNPAGSRMDFYWGRTADGRPAALFPDRGAERLWFVNGVRVDDRLGDHVYALGSQNPVKSHPIYAARWSAEQVRRGNLLAPEWWAGERVGWVSDASSEPRWPLFENAQAELTVHADPATGRFLAVHTQGFGPADVTMRAAPSLTGPWTPPRMIYRPPEYYRTNAMIYAGKAHPQLTGADLVLTYATNTFAGRELVTDNSLYYPRFVRLTRCR